MERCANCERNIGRLEKPSIWKQSIVCAACYERLNVASDDDNAIQKRADATKFLLILAGAAVVLVGAGFVLRMAVLQNTDSREAASYLSTWLTVANGMMILGLLVGMFAAGSFAVAMGKRAA